MDAVIRDFEDDKYPWEYGSDSDMRINSWIMRVIETMHFNNISLLHLHSAQCVIVP